MTRWRNASGRRGWEYLEVDEMTVVRRKGEDRHYLYAKRGKGPIVDDWGPFEIDPRDPFRQAREWNEALRKKGWFEADLAEWNTERISNIVARLPRSEAIPRYFLKTFDNLRLAKGKGAKKNTLLVGGVDVRLSDSIGAAGADAFQPRRESATVSFAHPGSRPLDPRNVTMRVDGPALEALIGFLLDVRGDLVSEETARALDEATFGEASQRPEDIRERVLHYYKIRDDVDGLTATIMRMSPDKREVAYALVEQLAAGDLQIAFGLSDVEPNEASTRH